MAEQKERPISFSAPMVWALLEGRKTQTRRVVKDTPIERNGYLCTKNITYANEKQVRGIMPMLCPYGKPGDRLWVREAWKTGSELNKWNASEIAAKCLDAGYASPGAPTFYIADSTTRAWGDMDKEDFGDWGRYRHPRFMPRWASRITLEITEVRVQRLHEIGLLDARAEGCEVREFSLFGSDQLGRDRIGRTHYENLWESINGAGSWAANPWVWALTFKVVR